MDDVENVMLMLTEDEAMCLFRLLGHHIVGTGKNRTHLGNIWYALREIMRPEFPPPLNVLEDDDYSWRIYLKREDL